MTRGRSPLPPARRRRLLRLVTACALALGSLGAAAPAARAALVDPGTSLTIFIDTQTPAVASPGSVVRLAGRVRNTSEVPAQGVSVSLFGGPVLRSRADLDDANLSSVRFLTGGQRLPDRLAPGAEVPFALEVPADLGGLASVNGVHPLRVRVDGRLDVDGQRSAVEPLGTADTYLASWPDAAATPVRAAWLWPLTDRPRLQADRTFTDDSLRTQVGPGGRLDRLLAAAEGVPGAAPGARLTVAVDPALLEALQLMAAGPYQVRVGPDVQQQSLSTSAAAFLQRLRAVAARGCLLVLPYADADVSALVKRTRGQAGGALPVAGTDLTTDLAREVLGPMPITTIAWPVGEQADAATVDALVAGGADGLVLSEQSIPLAEDRRVPTPTAVDRVATGGGQTRVLVADGRLSQLLAAGVPPGQTVATTAARFQAETALMAVEEPGDPPRVLLLVPPRAGLSDPELADELLGMTATDPWLDPQPLTAVQSDPPAPRGDRGPVVAPRDPPPALAQGYLARVADVAVGVRDLRTLVVDDAYSQPFTRAVYRSESVWWRDEPAAAEAFLRVTDQTVRGQLSAVKVTAAPRVTLTGRDGQIPVTVVNELPVGVRVRVALLARNTARLRPRGPSEVELAPSSRQQVDLQATVEGAGTFPVVLQLRTGEGRSIGPTTELLVRSTAYGTVAVALTGTALVVLVGALAVRAMRALRRRPRRRVTAAS